MSGGDQVNSNFNQGNGPEQLQYDGYFDHPEMMSIPSIGVLGNHDSVVNGGHYVHFYEPNMDPNYGIGQNYKGEFDGANYYFVYDSMLCIVLNLNSFENDESHFPADAQHKRTAENHIEFIDKVLEETKDNKEIKWKVILQHQSPYGGSYHNNYKATNLNVTGYTRSEVHVYQNIKKYLFPAFYERGFDLVLSGHDHTYTRTHILKPVKDTDGNYTADAEISPYSNTSGENYYTYEDETTTPTYVDWTDLNGVKYTNLKVSSKPVRVTDPDGVLYVTGSSASGSGVNDNIAPNHYAAVSLGHEEKLEKLGFDAGIRRQAVRIDVTPKTLTLTNYGLGGSTSDVDPSSNVLDTFTIERTAPVPVTGISMGKTETTIPVGGQEKLVTRLIPAEPDNSKIHWSSLNDEVARVDEDGVVSAVGTGRTTIIATTDEGSYSVSCEVTVVDAVPVTGIMLDKEEVTLKVGETKTVYATIMPEDATTKDVTWGVYNPTIATVSGNGSIKAVAPGITTVTAVTKDGKMSDSCVVNVEKVPVDSVSFDNESTSVTVLDSMHIKANVLPANATYPAVTYRSSNPSVVSVDSTTGYITALKRGTVTITATADGKTGSCTVTSKGGVLFTQDYEDVSTNKVLVKNNYGWSIVKETDGNWILQLKRDATTAVKHEQYPADWVESDVNGVAPMPSGDFVLSFDFCNMSAAGAPLYTINAFDHGELAHWYTIQTKDFEPGVWYHVKIVCSEEKGGANDTSVGYKMKFGDTVYEPLDIKSYAHKISSRGKDRVIFFCLDNMQNDSKYPTALTEEQLLNTHIKLDNIKVSSEASSPVIVKTETTDKAWKFKVSVAGISEECKVYLAAYDKKDKVVGISVANINKSGSTEMEMGIPAAEVAYFKAFVWDEKFKPLLPMGYLENN